MTLPFFVISAWLAASGPSQGLLSDPKAMEHFEKAQGAFNEGDYEKASAELEQAFLVEPADALLYPWAQAERFSGRCDVAVDLYRKFLDTDPSENFREAAEENLGRCEKELEDADAAAADAAAQEEDKEPLDDGWDDVAADEEESVPTPTKTDEGPKKWYLDPVGGVLSGVGLAGVATGGALLGVAMSSAGKVNDENTNDDYLSARDKATQLRTGGLIALSIGGALLVGGAVRYAIVGTRAKKQAASLWIGPRGMAGMVFVRRF